MPIITHTKHAGMTDAYIKEVAAFAERRWDFKIPVRAIINVYVVTRADLEANAVDGVDDGPGRSEAAGWITVRAGGSYAIYLVCSDPGAGWSPAEHPDAETAYLTLNLLHELRHLWQFLTGIFWSADNCRKLIFRDKTYSLEQIGRMAGSHPLAVGLPWELDALTHDAPALRAFRPDNKYFNETAARSEANVKEALNEKAMRPKKARKIKNNASVRMRNPQKEARDA